jgi:hypothetical protein
MDAKVPLIDTVRPSMTDSITLVFDQYGVVL